MKNMFCFLKWPTLKSVLFFLIISLECNAINETPELSIVTDKAPGLPVLHGLNKLTAALRAKNITFEKVGSMDEAHGKSVIIAGLAYEKGPASQMLLAGNRKVPRVAEALTIWRTNLQEKPVWIISGFDDRGLMYALLDVADRISWSNNQESPMSEVKEITEKPDVKERSISMYTMNRAYWESRFYDETFWSKYLDMLAKNRFNSLVVHLGYENGGFLAPCYPYFFNVEGFPNVQMAGITDEQQQRNLFSLNRLITMAHERGISFRLGIWSYIYRGGGQGGGILGFAGFDETEASEQPSPDQTRGVTTDNLVAYNKAAFAKLVKLVPKLDGVFFIMHGESGLKEGEMESFWLDVFQMIKKIAPNLRLYFHSKGLPDSIIQSALDVGVNFTISTKYWMEQLGMPYHPSHINHKDQFNRRQSYANWLSYPQQYKMFWNLWNGGSTRVLLWGDPEYARRFVQSTHLYDGESFGVNEPLATKMLAQPHDAKPFDLLNPQYRYYTYEFERYWHLFQVFGRIGYNPDTPDEVWDKEFEIRFGEEAGPIIKEALHQASWVLPRIVAACYPYMEGAFPTTRGWPEKQRLGDLPVYAGAEGSDIQQFANFDEEAQVLISGGETVKILPSITSQWFEKTSADINKLIAEAEKAIGNKRSKEFKSTLTDLKILSNLALFHSRRIPAAISYRLFVRTNDVSALEDAIAYEGNAIEAWRQIVAAAGDFYANDLMFGIHWFPFKDQGNGIGHLDGHWRDELVYLERGLISLEEERINFKPEGTVMTSPHYKVADNVSYDKLFQISHQPVTSAAVDEPLKISVKVSALNGIKWVRIRYRNVNQYQDYQSLEMLQTGGKDSFEATVSAKQINTKWDFMYFIEVMDNKGNGRIYPDLNKETPYIIVKLIR